MEKHLFKQPKSISQPIKLAIIQYKKFNDIVQKSYGLQPAVFIWKYDLHEDVSESKAKFADTMPIIKEGKPFPKTRRNAI